MLLCYYLTHYSIHLLHYLLIIHYCLIEFILSMKCFDKFQILLLYIIYRWYIRRTWSLVLKKIMIFDFICDVVIYIYTVVTKFSLLLCDFVANLLLVWFLISCLRLHVKLEKSKCLGTKKIEVFTWTFEDEQTLISWLHL